MLKLKCIFRKADVSCLSANGRHCRSLGVCWL